MAIKLNYVEFPARDLKATKKFFSVVFGWEFEYFGEDYCAFSEQGLDGGFYQSTLTSRTEFGAALLVFKVNDLAKIQAQIINAGGQICRDTFDFPGGSRFHFIEPSGNEFAVWCGG